MNPYNVYNTNTLMSQVPINVSGSVDLDWNNTAGVLTKINGDITLGSKTNNIDYTTITVSGTSFDLFGAPQPLPKKVVFSLSQAIKNLEEEEEEKKHG